MTIRGSCSCYGHADECVAAREEDKDVEGKYLCTNPIIWEIRDGIIPLSLAQPWIRELEILHESCKVKFSRVLEYEIKVLTKFDKPEDILIIFNSTRETVGFFSVPLIHFDFPMITNYGHPVRKLSSLHGRKSNPNPKFLGTAKAYFVCQSAQIFRFLWFMPSLGVRSPCLKPS